MVMKFSEIVSIMGSFLFPCSCFCCGKALSKNDMPVCDRCEDDFSVNSAPFCPVCGLSMKIPEARCRCKKKRPGFDRNYGLFVYTNPFKKLLMCFKYKDYTVLKSYFGKQLCAFIDIYDILNKYNISDVCCVALHRRKLNERGYNQSYLLAFEVCEKYQLQYLPVIDNKVYTKAQTTLNFEKRLINAKKRFYVNTNVEGKSILLIDDVITTGATLSECAYALKKAGAVNVIGLTLAITPAIRKKRQS